MENSQQTQIQGQANPNLTTPYKYGKMKGINSQMVYTWIRTGKVDEDCYKYDDLGRPVIIIDKFDQWFEKRREQFPSARER